jgi:cold shock CspA family protein
MSRSGESFNKKDVKTRKDKKRKDKELKKQSRKNQEKKGSLEDMMAYVNEDGTISSVPPDPGKKKEIKAEDIEISIARGDDVIDTIHTGVVSFFNESKGYGFIKDFETKQSVFVHVNEVEEPVKEGNRVAFEVVKGKKGLSAIKVRLDK